MCLIVFAYKAHPEYDLVLSTNRDEFYERPARPAQFWTEEQFPEMLAGKDLKAGGTWMGVHKDGRWASVTNYRDMSEIKENAPSRGELIPTFLKEKQSAVDWLQKLSQKSERYNGFNLLTWDNNGFFHFSNHNNVIGEIEPGIHGLSNALFNTAWPKLSIAKSGLKSIIQKKNIHKEDLFKLLLNEQKAADEELPKTGLPSALEKAVSSIFIKTENYGTRSSTVLLIDKDGKVDFTERTFKPGTSEVSNESNFTFQR